MKVILSRKGFDSLSGGITSAFFENGDMITFPIPENITNGIRLDTYQHLQYNDTVYSIILDSLGYRQSQICHIDPDLDINRRTYTIENWKPIFGQCDSTATHLLSTIKVEVGDIFLFFGNFHCIEKVGEKYRRVSKSGDFYKDNDLQIIWGYMQIGDIIVDSAEQQIYEWHPHASEHYTIKRSNVMFVGADKLSFDSSKPGYGVFQFDKKRVLTKENSTKANWIKNPVCDTNSIYGNRKNSSLNPDSSIYYRGQWQELGLVESDECTAWAKKIIEE